MSVFFNSPATYWRQMLASTIADEEQRMTKQYHLDMNQSSKMQQSKQIKLVRHDSMFEDEDHERSALESETIEVSVVEEPAIETQKMPVSSFQYNISTRETTSIRGRDLFALRFW